MESLQTIKANEWTSDQVALIKNTVARGTTNDEFKLFGYMASKYSLDPLIREIWCIKYGTAPATIFAGRDGFLSIAHRSGQFNGMKTEREFDKDGKIISATCKVYKKEMEHPIEVTVYIQEYDTKKSNWARMPITMLCKVAESQALRKAFNISGIYAEEEQGAIQATQTTTDTNHVEILSEEIQAQINECQNEDELKNLWIANKLLHKKTYFIQAVNNRKLELKNPQEQKTGYAAATGNPPLKSLEAEFTDEINDMLILQDSMSGLNAVWNEHKDLQTNPDFIALFNEQKLKLAKPEKK